MIYIYIGLYWLLQIYFYFMIINIFLTWIPNISEYRFFRICRKISNFYMEPFHGIIVLGPFDFTPVIGLFIYNFAINCLIFLMG
jgi:uncharacterized protein YggT (Ycf19 family)